MCRTKVNVSIVLEVATLKYLVWKNNVITCRMRLLLYYIVLIILVAFDHS